MAEGLRTEVHGNVGVVIMDRPPHNFLNFRQIHDIADALEEMQNDMSIRCAVLAADCDVANLQTVAEFAVITDVVHGFVGDWIAR